MIQNAAVVVSDDKYKDLFKNFNIKISILPSYIPDEEYFKPFFTPHKIPVFAYMGKINYYWKDKSLDRIVDIFSEVEEIIDCFLYVRVKGLMTFQDMLRIGI